MDESALRSVLDSSPIGAVVVDAAGVLRHCNRRGATLLGWPLDELLGRPDPSLPDAVRDDTMDRLTALIEHPGTAERQIVRRRGRDGSERHLVIEAVDRVELGDEPAVCLWFGSATDMDVVLTHRNRLSSGLAHVTRFEDAVSVLVEALHELLGAEHAVALRTCPSREHLHGLHGIGLQQEDAEEIELALGDGPWRAVLEDGEVVDAVGPHGDCHARMVPMGPGDDGWALLVCGDQVLGDGTLEVELARAVADETWIALQRAALVSDLDGKIEILEATTAIAGSVGLDLDDALAALTARAAEALSCERAAIYLVDDDGDAVLAHVHASDAVADALLRQDEGTALAQAVVDDGAEHLYQDVSACELAAGPWHADHGSVAVMGMPLQVGQRTVGALVVAHTVAHPRGFTSLCQQVGAAVAQQAALALEHARLFQVERRTVARLRELDRLKADWMAGLTHDLKAPLTGLLGFVETLRRLADHVSEEERQEYLAIMARQADQLVDLVEDLLLSARVDGDAVARRRSLVTMAEVVDDAVATLPPDRYERLTVVDDGVATPVLADRSHLQRVLVNLLSNAWRHGGERVQLGIGHEGGRVVVTIDDDGPGIEPERREIVFDRFEHGETPGSTGLGLYVARGIAEAHDGSLEIVDPPSGRGARFVLRLPRGRPQRAADLGPSEVAVARRASDRVGPGAAPAPR